MTTTREAALEAALLKTRRLVCEAAEVGFNYADGDWADRLYRNNGNIAAALSTPAADTRVVAVELLDRAMKTTMSGIVRAEIRAIIDTATPAQHDALAAANARADQARNAALVEAANEVEGIEGYDNIGGEHPLVSMILALRDKPAPGATPKIEVKFTWAKGDEEFWVHLKSPDGKSAGFNLGNPKGMIATALLRAIAGGGDE